MAIARMRLEEIRKRKPTTDRRRVSSTTDADVDWQIATDPDTAPDVTTLGSPIAAPLPEIEPGRIKAIRQRTGLTQAAFAGALRIPTASYRNWEQGRTRPDPVARSLLYLVEQDPKRVLGLLAAAE